MKQSQSVYTKDCSPSGKVERVKSNFGSLIVERITERETYLVRRTLVCHFLSGGVRILERLTAAAGDRVSWLTHSSYWPAWTTPVSVAPPPHCRCLWRKTTTTSPHAQVLWAVLPVLYEVNCNFNIWLLNESLCEPLVAADPDWYSTFVSILTYILMGPCSDDVLPYSRFFAEEGEYFSKPQVTLARLSSICHVKHGVFNKT